MKKTRIKEKSPHVPGQFLGFSLQVTRFIYRLLTAKQDSYISLEVFDDVGGEYPGNILIAEQNKSVTANGNPISNRSIDIWKTFSNWINAAETGELPPIRSSYVIYVSKQLRGNIAQHFSEANTLDLAKIAFNYARLELWGDAPHYAKRNEVPESLTTYLDKVFNADETILLEIIKNFTLEFGSGSPQSDLRCLVENSPFVPLDIADDVIRYIQGWVKEKIDLLLEQKKPAIIGFNEFKSEVTSYIRRHDNRTILDSFARSPNQEDISKGLLTTYIRQLELIESDQEQKICAINDYIRASIDRLEWANRGLVNDTSFQELEDKLKRTWIHVKAKNMIQFSEKCDVDKGVILYVDCSAYETDLQGMAVPPHFIPGNLHTLSEHLVIGWHPNFKNLLTPKCKDNES